MGNTLGRAMRSTRKPSLDPAVAAQALSIKEKGKHARNNAVFMNPYR